MSDPIADMLTRIRNGQKADKKSVTMPSSKAKIEIAKVLLQEGYIGGYDVSGEVKPELTVQLKYYQGKPVIDRIDRISKPGLRVYKSKDDLPKVMDGLGTAIISTSHGVIADKKARQLGCGGEVICVVI
jgi:small subunit ribosomal protein S8